MKRKFLLLLFIINCINFSNAQVPAWLWGRGAGGINNDVSTGIAHDHNNNIIVTGYYGSPAITFGSYILHNADTLGNTDDIFIVKYDADGNVQWAKSAGGINIDWANAIATDAYNNIVITGYFNSPFIAFDNDTLISSGGADVFTTKYDASGNLLWAKSAAGSGVDQAYGITTDVNNNIILTGSFAGPIIVFGSDTLISSGGTDVFITKYDASGNVIWAKSHGGGAGSSVLGCAITTGADNDIMLTGYFNGSSFTIGHDTLYNQDSSTNEIFMAKYDSSGNVLWSVIAHGSNNDYSTGIATDANNNVIITGCFYSPVLTFGSNALNNPNSTAITSDLFVAKYDPSGNILWAVRAGGINSDYSNSITTDGNYNIIITGGFNNVVITFGAYTLHNTDTVSGHCISSDIFVAEYDASGNVFWAENAGGIYSESGTGITHDAGNNIIITGTYTSPSLVFGSDTVSDSFLTGDVFVAKLDAGSLGINEKVVKIHDINVYPNPANDRITIACGENQKLVASIYNVVGMLVLQKDLSNSKNEIDISALTAGMYIVTVTREERIFERKLIKE